MGRRFKLGMSRMFHVSFLSCRYQNDAQVSPQAQQPKLVVRRDHSHVHDFSASSSAPNPATTSRHLPAAVRPGSTAVKTRPKKSHHPKPKSEIERQVLPPAPPASPVVPCIQLEEVNEKREEKANNNKERKTKKMNKKGEETSATTMPTTTTSSTDSPCFFSSEDEGEVIRKNHKIKSFSSSESDSSSEAAHLPCRRTMKRETCSCRKPRFSKQSSHSRPLESASKGKVEESVAVTKRSTDPYGDFRSSMVEMIIEKQIVRVEDLEQLLDCFLSLNSPYYHRIILDAFEEICEALSSNWC